MPATTRTPRKGGGYSSGSVSARVEPLGDVVRYARGLSSSNRGSRKKEHPMTQTPRSAAVVVISGAGAGLGAAMAAAFADDGYRVVVTDQHAERAEAVAGALNGEGHWACGLDVTDSDQWAELDAAVGERYGRIDVLINNAGVATGGMLGETPLDDWRWVLDIDLMGVVRGCHQFVGRFRSQGNEERRVGKECVSTCRSRWSPYH